MNETTDIATMMAPVWRRKWLILIVAIVVAAATYGYYHRQVHVYSATTQLDLSNGSEAQQLAGGSQAKINLNSRALANAATLITSSDVTEAVRARLRREHIQSKGLGKVRAKAASESYFITITTEAHSAKAAARLANDYALAYIERQHARYKSEVEAAIANTRRQLRRIEAGQAASLSAARRSSSSKGKGSTLARASTVGGSAVIETASLASKINQLESELSVSTVQQVNPAKAGNAQLVSPTPGKNALFGFVLGLLIAGIAVLSLSRFDRRIGSLTEIEAIFKTQILAVLPKESAPIAHQDGQPKPADSLLEPLRRLHTAIHLGDMLEPGAASPRLVLFLSADSGDGKSTLVADLALAQRDAGARVAVIEADLRRPVLAELLSVSDSLGLAEVLAGAAPFDQAVQSVGSMPRGAHADVARGGGGVSTIVQAPGTGSLSVLVGGGPVANPPALLASEGIREILHNATSEYDYVLIDTPPPLQVSDAMPLLHWVDGIVIVARMGHTQRTSAEHLARLLAASSTAPVLGVVANAVSQVDIKKSGFASTYGEQPRPRSR